MTTGALSMRAVFVLVVALGCACGSANKPPETAGTTLVSTAELPSKAPPASANSATCSKDAWCVVTVPKTVTFNAVWGAAANDVWVAGDAGTLLRWNGSAWSSVPSGTQSDLRALTGSSARDVWAAGLDGTLLHFDGSTWTATRPDGSPWSPTAGPNQRPIYSLFSAQPNQVWVGGSGIHHFDGSKWTEPHHHGSHLPVMAIWSAGAASTWAAGLQGTVYQVEGQHLARAGADVGPNWFGIWGSSPSDVWLVGSNGSTLHVTSAARVPVPSGTTNDLHAVRGFAANDVWAVGDEGTLLHWQGSAWEKSLSPSPRGLLALWGASSNDLWTVGETGAVLRRQR